MLRRKIMARGERRGRLTAILVLIIYGLLLLLAASPLHIYLDNKIKVNVYDLPVFPLGSSHGSTNPYAKFCPLCAFLSLIFTLGTFIIFFNLEISRYLMFNAKYKHFYFPLIHYYYSLAPPEEIR